MTVCYPHPTNGLMVCSNLLQSTRVLSECKIRLLRKHINMFMRPIVSIKTMFCLFMRRTDPMSMSMSCLGHGNMDADKLTIRIIQRVISWYKIRVPVFWWKSPPLYEFAYFENSWSITPSYPTLNYYTWLFIDVNEKHWQ